MLHELSFKQGLWKSWVTLL